MWRRDVLGRSCFEIIGATAWILKWGTSQFFVWPYLYLYITSQPQNLLTPRTFPILRHPQYTRKTRRNILLWECNVSTRPLSGIAGPSFDCSASLERQLQNAGPSALRKSRRNVATRKNRPVGFLFIVFFEMLGARAKPRGASFARYMRIGGVCFIE